MNTNGTRPPFPVPRWSRANGAERVWGRALGRSAEFLALAAGLALWLALLVEPAKLAPSPIQGARTSTLDLPAGPIEEGARPGEFLGTVLGTVTDSTGDPVEGVAVFVRPLAMTLPPVVGAFITDALGRFRVTGLAAGRYSFVAIHGHHPPGALEAVPVFPDEIAVAATGCVEVDIVLDLHNVQDA